MKIAKILEEVRSAQSTEKTASVSNTVAQAAAPHDALVNALNQALAGDTTKTASVADPIADVRKIAQEIADTEAEAAVKQAQVLGAAWADAAITRFAEWQKVAAQMNATAPAYDTTEKAAALGYAETQADLEKLAEDSYVQGYNDTVLEIHALATDEFRKAAAVTSAVVDALQSAEG